jgi:uncharacterized protein with NAD-binding domain and iron-sulfur cluster
MNTVGNRADVIIAGAGIAGLSCAAALSGCGLRVVVLEALPLLGGRAASWKDPPTGETVDIGPHVITSEHRNFLALLERLGTGRGVCWQRQPLITLLDAGRQLRMRSSGLTPPLHGLPNLPNALRCVSMLDLLSNMRIGWCAMRLDEPGVLALDDIDALSFLRQHGVSGRFIQWFWASAMLALLNVPLERCSAASMMRVFRLLLGRSGYCFGFPAVGLAELYVPGCRRLIENGGGAVLTSTIVQAVLLGDDGCFEGFALEDGSQLRAGAGVLGLPPQGLAALQVQGAGAERLSPLVRLAGGLEPSRYVSTMLWFDRKLTRERFWSRVLAAGDLNTDFYDLSNIRGGARADSPSLIAANAIHASEAWTWSDAEVIARTCEELAEFVGPLATAELRHARVHRVPMAVPCPAPGFERARPRPESGVPGLWLAGDWTATSLPCSMESAARSGALAAEAVAAAHRRDLRIALPAPETRGLSGLLRRRRL